MPPSNVTIRVIRNRLPQITKGIAAEMRKELERQGFGLEGDVKNLIRSSTPSGKVYLRPGGRAHRASAPGQPPAIDTSTLIGSIHTRVIGPLSVAVGTDVEYAPGLEWGDESIAPRPFMKPTAEKRERVFGDAMEQAIERGSRA